ncbi:MAG: HK97 gp10 family phage protein [Eubacteriales bacterium]|nr:HK97 gp10 family phage protein [Eubacteriales bacterium]
MIEVDVSGLDDLAKRFEELGKSVDWFLKKLLIVLANQLESNIIQNTPVQTGELRHSWFITDIVKSGDTYEVTIVNNKEYASYVEYGHRQQEGRYVPALGKRLKNGWVEGQYFMTIEAKKFEEIVDDIIRQAVEEILKGLGG